MTFNNIKQAELNVAAAMGDIRRITALIQDGADPNACEQGLSPLVCACKARQVESVRVLLEAGATQNLDNILERWICSRSQEIAGLMLRHGADPHHFKGDSFASGPSTVEYAADNKAWGFLCAYIEYEPEGANTRIPRTGDTLLHNAARYNNKDLCAFLLHKGADPLLPDRDGRPTLELAPKGSDVYRMLERYIRKGKLPKFPEAAQEPPREMLPPLFEVIHTGNKTLLEMMLELGGSATATLPDGTSALHYAADRSDQGCLGILLKHGAGVAARNARGETPLHLAVKKENAACVSMLLKAGADPNIDGGALLLTACSENTSPCITAKLLHAGADPTVTTADGKTLLDLAREQGKKNKISMLELYCSTGGFTRFSTSEIRQAAKYAPLDVLEKLLQEGADPNAADEYGETPIHYADRAHYESMERLRLLIRYGADFCHRDKWGVSFINEWLDMSDCDRENPCIVELLQGLDVNRLDARGCTVLHYAVYEGCYNVVKQLLEIGADPTIRTAEGGLPIEIALGRMEDDDSGHGKIAELLRPVSPEPR